MMRRSQQGLSLLELMIALTIGLGLLAALTTVFVNSSRSQTELARASQQIENGRFAVQTLQDNLWHAGFYGRHIAYTTTAPVALPDPCSTNIDTGVPLPTPLQNAIVFAVQGYNDPASVPTALTCLSASDFVATNDILIVRRAESRVTPVASLAADTLYLQSVAEPYNPTTLQPLKPVIAKGNPATAFSQASPTTGELGEIRRFQVHIYFVAPCSAPAVVGGTSCTGATDDGGRPIPTLKRLELGPAGTFQIVPLVEGIEKFQVEYGLDTPLVGLPAGAPYAGDGMPDAYVAAPTTEQFTQVVAVRLHILARTTEPSGGYVDGKTYDLGLHGTYEPNLVAADRPYKRHLFTTVVRVQNVAGWREK